MKATRSDVPPFRVHKATGQAYVRLDGRRRYLGRADLPDAHERYNRAVAEWLARGRTEPVKGGRISVCELVERYLTFAESYYVDPSGITTKEPHAIGQACKPMVALYGRTPAEQFGPLALKAVRGRMVAESDWSRQNTNGQVGRIRRVFRWGVSEEMIPASVLYALESVPGLKRNRTAAREGKPVRPVSDGHIAAIEPYVSRQVWALINLQLLTGARPGEIVGLRPIDLDTSGRVWSVKLAEHKNAYRGHDRIVLIGPKAQLVVEPFLNRPVDAFLFSPAEAVAAVRDRRTAERKTPLSCGNVVGSTRRRRPKRSPGDRYTTGSYRRAIERGCKRADVQTWTPHQLRHNAATTLRAEFGIEAAKVVLGHASMAATSVYAERDARKAVEIMQLVG